MKCRKVKKYLSVFLDGELDVKERLEIEAHLKKCFSCSHERDLLQDSWEMLGRWNDIEPSAHFKAGFWRKVQEQESGKRKQVLYPRMFPRWAVALATATILLVCISLHFSPRIGRQLALPYLVREHSKMLVSGDRESDLKESMDRVTYEEMGEIIQAVTEEADALELALVTEGEKYLKVVMNDLFDTEFSEKIIVFN